MIDKIKELIIKCIQLNNYADALKLVIKLMSTDVQMDAEAYYLCALVADHEGLYGPARMFMERACSFDGGNVYADVLSAFSNGNTVLPFECDYTGKEKRLRIIVITETMYDILNYFLEQYIATYRILGHVVYELPMREEAMNDELEAFARLGVDFIVSFNNSYSAFRVNGMMLYQAIGCKVFNILVDNPVYYTLKAIHTFQDENVCEIVIDKLHLKYLEESTRIGTTNIFMPHGGVPLDFEIKPLKDRNIDVLYVGSTKCNDKQESDLINACVTALIDNPNKDPREVISEVFGMQPEFVDGYTEEEIDLAETKEWDAVGYYRVKAVQMLVEAGIKVHVHGPGWDLVPFADNENLIRGPLLNSKECIEYMYDTKIVLNSMPWFKDGTHERVFNGMLAGAINITDSSKWFQENLENGKELFMFDLSNMTELVTMAEKIISNPDKYQDMADKGRNKAIALHTWSHRAMEIIDVYCKL